MLINKLDIFQKLTRLISNNIVQAKLLLQCAPVLNPKPQKKKRKKKSMYLFLNLHIYKILDLFSSVYIPSPETQIR
jgi:hypothetical protein